MKRLSAYDAAGEGFALMRREPWAFAAWTGVWFVTFSIAAWTVAVSRPVGQTALVAPDTLAGIAARFGPFWAYLVALFVLVWLITAVATFRAVLRPAERACFFLRFSADELRLGLLTLIAFLAAIPLGGAPAYFIFVLFSPLMRAIPDATRAFTVAGAALTIWVDVWLSVRLSLIAVETFSERRFHLTAYWPVTRGRFWYLLGCYIFVFLVLLGLLALLFVVSLLLPPVNGPHPTTILDRGGLLLQAGLLTALISLFWTISSTIFYACQAHAFRAVVGEGRDGVAPA